MVYVTYVIVVLEKSDGSFWTRPGEIID